MEQITKRESKLKDNKMRFRSLQSFDARVTTNLRAGEIETRPANSNGLWCSALLPAILLTYNARYEVSAVYSLAAYVSVGLFLYFALLMVFISLSKNVLNETFHGGVMACSLTSTLLVYSFLNQDLLVSLVLTVSAVLTSGVLLRNILMRFPKTYTIGEAAILSQGLALFAVVALGKVIMTTDDGNREAGLVDTIVYTALATVVSIIATFKLLHKHAQTLQNFYRLFFVNVVLAIAVLAYYLGIDFLFKFGAFVFEKSRLKIIMFWLSLVVQSIAFICYRVRAGVPADTATRKVFHILASSVFTAGMLFDQELMKLASGVVLAALIFVEALRKFNLEPYSSKLQAAFDLYADEKDMGSFAMTPIYLYVGLSCPLLLVPPHAGSELELLSGVLAIGVGDSAASWFGSRYGAYKWPDSERTKEGTACNIASQIFVVYVLQLLGVLTTHRAVWRASIAAVISALVEAGLSQVDNLILPLVSILAFQATTFVSFPPS